MRESLFILIFLASGFFASANAQVTAVMQARVNIISGGSITSVEESKIDLSTADFSVGHEVLAGTFSLVAAPETDVNVSIAQQPMLKNKEGQRIEMGPLKISKSVSENGEQHISLNGKVRSSGNMSGEYKGAVTAVIEYL